MMSLFERIRRFIFNLFLSKKRNTTREPVSLLRAKKIGILFPANDIPTNDVILDYAQSLKLKMKDVQLLGYLPKREFGFVYPFTFITDKDKTWFGKPKGSNTGFFTNFPFDLIINFCEEDCLPLEYISAASSSKFRVGFNPDASIANYDLILISKENRDIRNQIRTLETYLN